MCYTSCEWVVVIPKVDAKRAAGGVRDAVVGGTHGVIVIPTGNSVPNSAYGFHSTSSCSPSEQQMQGSILDIGMGGRSGGVEDIWVQSCDARERTDDRSLELGFARSVCNDDHVAKNDQSVHLQQTVARLTALHPGGV